MLEAIVVAVVAGLIVIAIVGAVKWLQSGANRDDLRLWIKQRTCRRHDWRPIEESLGPNMIYITSKEKYCSKCGKER